MNADYKKDLLDRLAASKERYKKVPPRGGDHEVGKAYLAVLAEAVSALIDWAPAGGKPEKKPKAKDALDRAMEFMTVPMGDLPPAALAYAKELGKRYGGCGEVFLTAYAAYAELVEELPPSEDEAYRASPEAVIFFADWGRTHPSGDPKERSRRPRRFRFPTTDGQHPNGTACPWRYGCYFPQTDLCVNDMGGRGTGVPGNVEWLDEEAK